VGALLQPIKVCYGSKMTHTGVLVLNRLLIDSFHDNSLISIFNIYIYIFIFKKMYCVKCRTVTNTADAQYFITKNRSL